ncbi:hypothetical protein IAU59_007022 [Kwoniella sp. CBS 9459]
MVKRLVMNPPASFLEYAASLQPDIPVPAGPLVISQSGQAVMLSPNTNTPASSKSDSSAGAGTGADAKMKDRITSPAPQVGDAQAEPVKEIKAGTVTATDQVDNAAGGEVVLDGSSLMLVPDATTAFLAATAAATASATDIATPIITSASAVSASVTLKSTSVSTTAGTSSAITWTASAAPSTVSATGSSPPSYTSATASTASATATASSSSSSGAHKPPSAGIIFLIVLLALAVFIAIASLLRYFLRLRSASSKSAWASSVFGPCFGGRRRRDRDDDDLSDIVRFEGGRAYDPFSDGKEFNHHTMSEEDIPSMHHHQRGVTGEEGYGGLERRASLFAREGRSPFLHSGTSDHPSPELPPFHSTFGSGAETGHASYLNPSPLELPVPPAQAFTKARFRAAASRGAGAGAGAGGLTDLAPYLSAGAGREESIAPLPGHLYGQTGPLEVRNALPGEVEPDDDYDHDHDYRHQAEEGYNENPSDVRKNGSGKRGDEESEARGVDGLVGLGLGGGSPRFLGLDGTGLSVPWSVSLPHRPSSIDSFDAHQHHPNPFGSSSTLTADHVRHHTAPTSAEGLNAPPMFSSPVPSHDNDSENDDLSLPQRSATWASNLRNTLYNAISAASASTSASASATVSVRNPSAGLGGLVNEDRFTRTVGAVVRASSRRKAIPSFAASTGFGFDDLEKGLQIVDEKDDPFPAQENEKCFVPPVPATTAGKVHLSAKMLSRIESGNSSSSGSTLMVLPRRKGATAGERYKQYYARPRSVSGLSPVPMADMPSDGGAESEVEAEVVRPPALGAGTRAKGARTGSFVVV